MHCYTTMQTVIPTSVHCLSGKGRSLIISHLQRWSLSLYKPKIHNSFHKMSQFFPITNKLGLLDTIKIFLFNKRFIIPFWFRLSSLLRNSTRMLRTILTSTMLVSCFAYLCNLHVQNKQRTHKNFASNINYQTRTNGAFLRPMHSFHLLVSTNVSQTKISLDPGLFYMLSTDSRGNPV